jgi:hypothetical protein
MLPAFLLLAGVLVRFGRARRVAVFYVLAFLLGWLAVAYTYWVTAIPDVVAFEERTGPRIVLGVVFIMGAGLAHLLAAGAAALDPAAEAPDRVPPAAEPEPEPAVTGAAPAR